MLHDFWQDIDDVSPWLTGGIRILVVLVVAVAAQRMFRALVRRSYWRRVDRRSELITDPAELGRLKRQKTFATLLESMVRYGVYGAAVIIAIGTIRPGAEGAFFSAGLLAVVLGFGMQRLLGDVVAGALLLFEGHFAVGDVITVHAQNVTGVVEEFSLRTTRLRTFAGDTVTILNGGMVSVTRWSYGQREYRIELMLRDEVGAAAVRAAVAREAELPGGLWIVPPQVEPLEQGDVVRVRTVVAPDQEVLVTRLASVLEAAAGDAVVGDALVLPIYVPVFDTWRSGVLLRG